MVRRSRAGSGDGLRAGSSFTRSRPVKGHIRLASRLGFEFVLGRSRYGLQLVLRSFFEPLAYTGNDGAERISQGVGAIFEVAFLRYRTQTKR